MTTDTVLVLYSGEDIELTIPVANDDSMDGEEVVFTVENSRKALVFTNDYTVADGNITIASTAEITMPRRDTMLPWSIRKQTTKELVQAGTITIRYQPLATETSSSE